MRNDAVGFFWDDTPPPKPDKKEKEKRQPPEAVWLRSDYLPGLEEARLFPVEIMTIEELIAARANREELLHDVECFPNYYLAVFTNLVTGKIVYFEKYEGCELNVQKLKWIMESFVIVTFNGNVYDIPMTEMAVGGCTNTQLKTASDEIIQQDLRGSDVRRKAKCKALKVDHIDLIEVAPLFGSLKTYAGRMHARKMQDLPFHPSTVLTADQITIVRWYCVNDTRNTAQLRECLNDQIELRYNLSNEYQIDLRSKSDAQIAEAVIAAEIKKRTGSRPEKPKIDVGTTYRYATPHYLQFRSGVLQQALGIIQQANFVVDYTGAVGMPEEIKNLALNINGAVYRMGIGGLHSSESSTAHITDSEYIVLDKDVTSFYPFLILNQGLYPPHLGPIFLQVYRGILNRRLAAKRAGDKVVAESLKIVVNGSFGKLGSQYSILYAPNLLIQTTVTGQLVLLMLIERLEMAGIRVVSANTDGIAIKCHRSMISVMNSIVTEWEKETNLQTEEIRYLGLYSRDVNNYIAVKQKEVKNTDGSISWVETPSGVKTKGAYANPWSDQKNRAMRLHKNPTATICVEAVEAFLTTGHPIHSYIRSSKDITKFVSVRSARGGAVKVWDKIPPVYTDEIELLTRAGYRKFAEGSWTDVENDTLGRYAIAQEKAVALAIDLLSESGPTEYLGKVVRWYYAKNVNGELVYAGSGNKVPRSDGARPCMILPDTMPDDIDYDWYINEAVKILEQIAAITPIAAES